MGQTNRERAVSSAPCCFGVRKGSATLACLSRSARCHAVLRAVYSIAFHSLTSSLSTIAPTIPSSGLAFSPALPLQREKSLFFTEAQIGCNCLWRAPPICGLPDCCEKIEFCRFQPAPYSISAPTRKPPRGSEAISRRASTCVWRCSKGVTDQPATGKQRYRQEGLVAVLGWFA